MDTVAAVSRRGDSEGEEGPAVAEFAEQPAKNTKLLTTTNRGAGESPLQHPFEAMSCCSHTFKVFARKSSQTY